MKQTTWIQSSLLAILIMFSGCVAPDDDISGEVKELQFETSYTPEYRIWLGFKRKSISSNNLLSKLKSNFIPATKLRSENGLISYILAIPSKANGVPDTISLSAYTSKRVLLEASREPRAKHYANHRWNLYDRRKTISKIPIGAEKSGNLIASNAYDLLSTPVNWQFGHSTVTIERKNTSTKYLSRLSALLKKETNSFTKRGLKGYVICIHKDYLISFENWTIGKARKMALSSAAGKRLRKERSKILSKISHMPADRFNSSLSAGKAVFLKFQNN